MFSDSIEGIEKLRSRLPVELQAWCHFSQVNDMHFYSDLDDLGQDVKCLDITLSSHDDPTLKVKLHLWNMHGKVAFETNNGFCSGLTIDDLSENGYEKNARFHLYSCEMDIDPDIYCERISVELV
ncbi:hypothetical protein SAMN05216413_1675 [Ruminococcaceae bacterium KH2T8]|nr:hypothetical protein SAMN05216413_1675 [Ruminococcaceae bacterium KH2T8]